MGVPAGIATFRTGNRINNINTLTMLIKTNSPITPRKGAGVYEEPRITVRNVAPGKSLCGSYTIQEVTEEDEDWD